MLPPPASWAAARQQQGTPCELLVPLHACMHGCMTAWAVGPAPAWVSGRPLGLIRCADIAAVIVVAQSPRIVKLLQQSDSAPAKSGAVRKAGRYFGDRGREFAAR